MKAKEIAIIIAAGKGSRMLPLSEKIPKPLIEVRGIAMIETIIQSLQLRCVDEIYITVGYKKEKFEYLVEKYSNIVLVENKDYAQKNNISSLYALGEIMGSADCFICDADLYINDKNIFKDAELSETCFFGKYISGKNDDWVIKTNGSKIIHITIGGNNDYGLVGIAYLKKSAAAYLKQQVDIVYGRCEYDNYFWEEIADLHLDKIGAVLYSIEPDNVVEIDTYSELQAFDESYRVKR